MSFKTTLLLLLAGACLGGATWYYAARQETKHGGGFFFSRHPPAAVVKVEIERRASRSSTVKGAAATKKKKTEKSSGIKNKAAALGKTERETVRFERHGASWRLTAPLKDAADTGGVARIITAVQDALTDSFLDADERHLREYGFLGPDADKTVRVTLCYADGSRRTLEIGRRSRYKNSHYVRRPDANLVGLVDFDFVQPFALSLAAYRSREILPPPEEATAVPEATKLDPAARRKQREKQLKKLLSSFVRLERRPFRLTGQEQQKQPAASNAPALVVRRKNLASFEWRLQWRKETLRADPRRVEKLLNFTATRRLSEFLRGRMVSAETESYPPAPPNTTTNSPAVLLKEAWEWRFFRAGEVTKDGRPKKEAVPLRLVFGTAVWGTEERLVVYVPWRKLWGVAGTILPKFLSAPPEKWRDRRLFRHDPRRATALELVTPNKNGGWKLVRHRHVWKCAARKGFAVERRFVKEYLDKLAAGSITSPPLPFSGGNGEAKKTAGAPGEKLQTASAKPERRRLELTFPAANGSGEVREAVELETPLGEDKDGSGTRQGERKALLWRTGETLPLWGEAEIAALFHRSLLSFRSLWIWQVSPEAWRRVEIESFSAEGEAEGGFTIERDHRGLWKATRATGRWKALALGAESVDTAALARFLQLVGRLHAKRIIGEASDEKDAVKYLQLPPLRWTARLKARRRFKARRETTGTSKENGREATRTYRLVFGCDKEKRAAWLGAWLEEDYGKQRKRKFLLCFEPDSEERPRPALLRGAPAPGE